MLLKVPEDPGHHKAHSEEATPYVEEKEERKKAETRSSTASPIGTTEIVRAARCLMDFRSEIG